MNRELLKAIQKVEAKHGSVASPFADLSEVHRITKQLGLTSQRYKARNNNYWYSKSTREFCTYSEKLVKIFKLLDQGVGLNEAWTRIKGVDTGIVTEVSQIQKAHYKIRLMSKV